MILIGQATGVKEVFIFVRNNFKVRFTKAARYCLDKPDYAECAVTEAIVNALIHRDYTVLGSEIHINMYDDRVEIQHLEKVATNTVSFGIIHTGYGVGRFYPFFVQAFFIRDYREIPECILLCMFLCKSRLFKIYEYHCWYNAEAYT